MGFIVNPTGAKLTGYTADASGVLSTGAPGPLSINTADLAPLVTSEVNSVLNLDSTKTALLAANFDKDDPQTYHNSTAVSVYDSLGNSHTLQTFYVKTAPGTWDVFASLDGGASFSPTPNTLTFDTAGLIDTTATTLPLSVGPLAVSHGCGPSEFQTPLQRNHPVWFRVQRQRPEPGRLYLRPSVRLQHR